MDREYGIMEITKFNTKEDNAPDRWDEWFRIFTRYVKQTIFKTDEEQVNHLIYVVGDQVASYIEATRTANDKTIVDIKKIVDKYLKPTINKHIARFKFKSMKQYPEERFESFVDRLNSVAASCSFTDKEEQIVDQILQGCTSDGLRTKALHNDKITLEELRQWGRTSEAVNEFLTEKKKHTGENSDEDTIYHLKHRREATSNGDGKQQREREKRACWNCGGSFPHVEEECPAKNIKCHRCGKIGHYKKFCRKTQSAPKAYSATSTQCANLISVEDKANNSEGGQHQCNNCNQYSGGIRGGNPGRGYGSIENVWTLDNRDNKLPSIELTLCQTKKRFTIDSGATINLMNKSEFEELVIKPKLYRSNTKVFAYGSNVPIKIVGEFETRILYNGQFRVVKFQVVDGFGGNILGYQSLMDLNIIKVVNQVTVARDQVKEKLASQYPKLFSGRIGKLLNYQVKLHINNEVRPVQQRKRPTPVHLRGGIEKALKQMLDNDIIEPVEGPTPWISPIVPIPKANGDVRLCTDARLINTALSREVHNVPTIEEVTMELNGAQVISKIDLNSGYNQVELDKESRDITVFATHVGLFRHKRLTFGLLPAGDEFQKAIEMVIRGIEGARNISDDIIIYGATNEEHDKRLHQVLKRLEDARLKVKPHELKVDDRVIVKNHGTFLEKSKPRYDPIPYIVKEVNGTMVTAGRVDRKDITRNSSFFQKIDKKVSEMKARKRSSLLYRNSNVAAAVSSVTTATSSTASPNTSTVSGMSINTSDDEIEGEVNAPATPTPVQKDAEEKPATPALFDLLGHDDSLDEKDGGDFDDDVGQQNKKEGEELTQASDETEEEEAMQHGEDKVQSDNTRSHGIYHEPRCSQVFLDHAVAVVGYSSANGKYYWIVKNSWGRNWGQMGFIHMSRNRRNNCGIATDAVYTVL